jgi:hypothetical protein
MLPPILEIYVVWHPRDRGGREVSEVMVNHFQGSTFSGLIGGAIEVYVRSPGWRSASDAPRPIPFPSDDAGDPNDSPQQQRFTAVVPVVGTELAAAVEPGVGPWYEYLIGIVHAQGTNPDRVAVFPVATESSAAHGTVLGRVLEPFHGIGRGRMLVDEERSRTWCRDLAQGVAQHFGELASRTSGHFGFDAGRRLTVFISHTNELDGPGHPGDAGIAERVRGIVAKTRLDEFFSASDLQPGRNWSHELAAKATTSALLAVRTSTYASRPWCQREMLLAKTAGMPIVVLDALEHPEERGSFLMDHVPRVPVRRDGDGWRDADILAGLNLLVDECLKHALWQRQGQLLAPEAGPAAMWWAAHAPEPVTLVAWLHEQLDAGRLPATGPIRIVHPDPPIGPDELAVLEQIVRLADLDNRLDVVTPRMLAARAT